MKRFTSLIFFFFLLVNLPAQTHSWTRTNPGGGGAFNLIGAGPPASNGAAQIIAGSDLSGAYYSWDGGVTWQVYGSERGLLNTHVCGLGFHPTDPEIFFLGVDGGIFKSNSGGGFFYEVFDNGYVTDLEVSEVNSQIVFAAHHSEYNVSDGSILKSTDGGENFSKINNNSLPNDLHLLEIIAHPLDANIVFALSGDGRFTGGVASAFRSTDGGINWSPLTPTTDEVMHLALNENTLYLTTMLPIIDGGQCTEGNKGHLYKSTDSGTTWQNQAIAPYTGIIFLDNEQPDQIRLIDPRCPYFWFNDSGTWSSSDGGETWNRSGDPANWTTGFQDSGNPQWSYVTSYNGLSKTLGSSKTEPNTIFWANIQWVFGSFDGGNTFNHLHTEQIDNGWQSTGIDNVVMLDIASNASNPDEMYIGFADIGLWRSTNGGKSWQQENSTDFTGNWRGFGGNCHSVLTDPDVSGKVWASLQGDADEPVSLIFSNETGQTNSWQKLGNGIPDTTTNLWGMSLDENSLQNNRTLFASVDGNIFKSINDGADWEQVLQNGKLYYTAIDRKNGQIVYAGGADGLYRSNDGGNSWNQIVDMPSVSGNISQSPYHEEYVGISSVIADPNVEGKVFYSFYGGNSTVGGAYVFENNTSNLLYATPYLRCITTNPTDPRQMYIGSSYAFYRGFYHPDSEGVLYSSDGGNNWAAVNGDMPWHSAVCMEITEETVPRIFAGSPGSGFQVETVGGQISSLVENSKNQDFFISANPFRDAFSVKSLKTSTETLQVQLFDLNGKKLLEKTMIEEVLIDGLESLESGMYFVKIFNKNQQVVFVEKMVKSN